MNGFTPLLVGAMLLAPLAFAGSALAEDAPRGAFIVRFAGFPEGLSVGDPFAGGRVLAVDRALSFAVVSLPQDSALTVAKSAHANVLDVEADTEVTLTDARGRSPDDARYAEQYGPARVRAPEAWAVERGNVDTRVCIVDTGVRHSHEDLTGARWLGGVDLVNGDRDPRDDNGHGTHVAGIAAGTTGNGKGTAGIAQVGILAAKVMDEAGRGRTSDVARGVRWCADAGADVITLSLGSPRPTRVLQDAVRYAAAKDALVVAAAGNSGPGSGVSYPAAFPEVLAVTCTDARDALCGFSSTGREAEIAAPGHRILAPWHTGDDDYKAISGTSMSAPHVAGVAALVRSHAPDLAATAVREVLRESARDLGRDGRDAAFGFGLVDARAALDRVTRGDVPAPEPEPAPAPAPSPVPEVNRRPVAVAGPEVKVRDDDGDGRVTVTLDGSRSRDADGRVVAYEWRYKGHVVSREATATVTLPVERLMLVTLFVMDDDGAVDGSLVRVRVDEAGRDPGSAPGRSRDHLDRNDRPHAAFTARCAGLVCAFDASPSTDADGDALAFEWRVGFRGATADGERVTVAFTVPGTYPVRLAVTDVHGRSDRETAWVRVG